MAHDVGKGPVMLPKLADWFTQAEELALLTVGYSAGGLGFVCIALAKRTTGVVVWCARRIDELTRRVESH